MQKNKKWLTIGASGSQPLSVVCRNACPYCRLIPHILYGDFSFLAFIIPYFQKFVKTLPAHGQRRQNIQEFFVAVFNNPKVATFLISILPIFELRGAIPFGLSATFWGEGALNLGTSFLISFLGSSLVVPIVALLFKPVLNFLKSTKMFNKIALKFENRIVEKSKSFENKNTRIKKMLGIVVFVGVPLPLTGVYTGTALAVVLGLRFADILFSVITGNLIAGSVITILSMFNENTANIILITFVSIVVLTGMITLFKTAIKRFRNKKENV
jgi:uncharacterized membrane protein